MRNKLELLSFVLILASASPFAVERTNDLSAKDALVRNNVLEEMLMELLEELRELMTTGSENVPVLDPFHLDYLHLDEDDLDLPGSHVTIHDMEVRKLSTFVVDSLTVTAASLTRYNIEFEGHIPVLEVDVGNYDLFATASGYNIFGNGDAKMKIIQPRLTGRVLIGPRLIGMQLYVYECEIKFGLVGFEPEITGMFNDPPASEFVSLFLSHLVPEAVEYFEEEITEALSTFVQDTANQIFADLGINFPTNAVSKTSEGLDHFIEALLKYRMINKHFLPESVNIDLINM